MHLPFKATHRTKGCIKIRFFDLRFGRQSAGLTSGANVAVVSFRIYNVRSIASEKATESEHLGSTSADDRSRKQHIFKLDVEKFFCSILVSRKYLRQCQIMGAPTIRPRSDNSCVRSICPQDFHGRASFNRIRNPGTVTRGLRLTTISKVRSKPLFCSLETPVPTTPVDSVVVLPTLCVLKVRSDSRTIHHLARRRKEVVGSTRRQGLQVHADRHGACSTADAAAHAMFIRGARAVF